MTCVIAQNVSPPTHIRIITRKPRPSVTMVQQHRWVYLNDYVVMFDPSQRSTTYSTPSHTNLLNPNPHRSPPPSPPPHRNLLHHLLIPTSTHPPPTSSTSYSTLPHPTSFTFLSAPTSSNLIQPHLHIHPNPYSHPHSRHHRPHTQPHLIHTPTPSPGRHPPPTHSRPPPHLGSSAPGTRGTYI